MLVDYKQAIKKMSEKEFNEKVYLAIRVVVGKERMSSYIKEESEE